MDFTILEAIMKRKLKLKIRASFPMPAQRSKKKTFLTIFPIRTHYTFIQDDKI